MARSKTATVAPARKPKKQYKLLFMVLPFMVIVLLFNYVPIFGWIYSVFDYVPGVPILECDFMGLDYFKMIMKDANVIRALKNTFIFAGISIILTPLPMIFAILLNEIKSGPVRKFSADVYHSSELHQLGYHFSPWHFLCFPQTAF